MTIEPNTNAEEQEVGSLSGPAQAVLDNMQLGVTQTDADGEILYANPAVAQMHGYRVDELVGGNLSLFEEAVEVETDDGLALLQDMNCELAQGYLFSKALSHDDVTSLIGKHRYAV